MHVTSNRLDVVVEALGIQMIPNARATSMMDEGDVSR